MTVAIVILSLAFAVILILFILQQREIKSIARQLKKIKASSTNSLVHREGVSANELIKEVNSLLLEMRRKDTLYNRKSHAIEQMMTNISHDLRTPLTSAMGYIDIIQNSDLSNEEKERELRIIEKRLMRLQELINSFFEFSRIISCGKPPEKTKLNLVSALEESAANYYDDYSSKNRQIVINCNERKFDINSNKKILMRIFDNLISNALKHGDGNLIINLTACEKPQITFENELSANDTDIDINHIFDEFYTTDISRTKGNTGLGLAIAREFTELLGGKINAELKDNVFILTLSF